LSLGKCSSLFVSFSVWFYGYNLGIVLEPQVKGEYV